MEGREKGEQHRTAVPRSATGLFLCPWISPKQRSKQLPSVSSPRQPPSLPSSPATTGRAAPLMMRGRSFSLRPAQVGEDSAYPPPFLPCLLEPSLQLQRLCAEEAPPGAGSRQALGSAADPAKTGTVVDLRLDLGAVAGTAMPSRSHSGWSLGGFHFSEGGGKRARSATVKHFLTTH